MKVKRIAILGGGNLGSAIAEGLIKSNFISADQITITRRHTEELAPLANIGVTVTRDNMMAIENSDIIIAAVKPYNVKEILTGLKKSFAPKKHVVISVVTGVFLEDLAAILGREIPIFRAMPNRYDRCTY